MMSVVFARITVRTLLTVGVVCWLGACGSDSADSASPDAGHPVVRTDDVCGADADCRMEPDSICKDTKTIVRFDVPKCASDHRCTWIGSEDRCDYMCQDGYCITTGVE
ncbi:MAG TPA: hypothetical protein VK540_08380 [Polyangiaceae bacterium]|jgi:hypothetical protein|nr:hypothetical protein [Polyangiaceae bacterium]